MYKSGFAYIYVCTPCGCLRKQEEGIRASETGVTEPPRESSARVINALNREGASPPPPFIYLRGKLEAGDLAQW